MRFSFDGFELDSTRRELSFGGERMRVDPLVVDVLGCLLERAGEIVSYDDLIARVWDGRQVASNVITVSMAKLCRALRQHGGTDDYVKNVYGRGYSFVREVARETAGDSIAPHAAFDMARAEPSPFVGRDAVLKRLALAHADAREGRGSLCVLIGEAGIGKTRSVEAFEQSAGADAAFFWGRARELEGAPPLWPLLQILRELLAALGTARAESALGSSFLDLRELLPELGTRELGARHPENRFRVYESVLRLLALDAGESARVIVLDDLPRGAAGRDGRARGDVCARGGSTSQRGDRLRRRGADATPRARRARPRTGNVAAPPLRDPLPALARAARVRRAGRGGRARARGSARARAPLRRRADLGRTNDVAFARDGHAPWHERAARTCARALARRRSRDARDRVRPSVVDAAALLHARCELSPRRRSARLCAREHVG